MCYGEEVTEKSLLLLVWPDGPIGSQQWLGGWREFPNKEWII